MNPVLIFNNQIESLLPDKPSRLQVLNKIGDIKSLETQSRKISIYLHDDLYWQKFKNLYHAINGKIIKDSLPVFYYEVPKVLYNWFISHSFREITNQISLYFGYLRHILKNSTVFYDDFYHSPINNVIIKAFDAIKNCDISLNDMFRYRYLIKKHLNGKSRVDIYTTLKYWKLSEKYLKRLPIDPMLSNEPVKENSEWYQVYNNFDIPYKAYMSHKGYKNIEMNRLATVAQNYDDKYSDKYLDLWKYFYVNKSIKYQEINGISCVNITSVNRYENEIKLCDICGDDIVDLLIRFGVVKESKPLCIECYLWEYFE